MRREYKYLVDERTAERVRRTIDGICTRDEHAGATGRYLVDTLYLDSLDHRLYRATVENEAKRHKLRIRTYPGTNVVFLEVKRRIGDVIVKSRAALGPEWREILDDADVSRVPESQRPGAESFLAYYHASPLGPMVPAVLIRYEREPYSSTLDPYARVTFDRSITYQYASELSVRGDDAAWIAIDDPIAMRGLSTSSLAVLELKFEGPAPAWMVSLVRTLDLPRLAFSKYGRAIESLTMTPSARAAF